MNANVKKALKGGLAGLSSLAPAGSSPGPRQFSSSPSFSAGQTAGQGFKSIFGRKKKKTGTTPVGNADLDTIG